ncbi:MAG: nitronate monooxygenase [Pedobacter sp.]|nr:MAG: nitronate monooxygenase [Pedobacter sp.]
MKYKTQLIDLLKVKLPLIVAPMAGGPTTVKLVVAASEAGALGSLGAAYYSPKLITDSIKVIRALTDQPFAVNLFVPQPVPDVTEGHLKLAIAKTQGYRAEMSLPAPRLTSPYEENFDQQFEAVLSQKPHVLSFVFGVLAPEYMKETKKQGIFTMGTATSLEEGLLLQDSGVNAIVAQGMEAGGHRGIFDPTAPDPQIRTLDLVRMLKAQVHVPIVAAGGIMNRDDVQRMMNEGVGGVQMGTAFLAVQEAGTSQPYRRKLLESSARDTRTTRVFSGRLARGIVNRFMDEMGPQPEAVLPFPAQNKFTRDLRGGAVAANSSDLLSLWAGTGTGELWTGPARELIQSLFI